MSGWPALCQTPTRQCSQSRSSFGAWDSSKSFLTFIYPPAHSQLVDRTSASSQNIVRAWLFNIGEKKSTPYMEPSTLKSRGRQNRRVRQVNIDTACRGGQDLQDGDHERGTPGAFTEVFSRDGNTRLPHEPRVAKRSVITTCRYPLSYCECTRYIGNGIKDSKTFRLQAIFLFDEEEACCYCC